MKTKSNWDFTFEQKLDIGLKFVYDLLEPACAYGVKLLKSKSLFTPDEQSALEDELDNVSIMLAALNKTPEKIDAVRHALSTLKDITGSIKSCSDKPLDEIELFELNAFLLRLRELIPIVECIDGYKDLNGIFFAQVDELLSVLDPEGFGKLSFYIEDMRTPRLLRLRQKKRELEAMQTKQDLNNENTEAMLLRVAAEEESELLSIYALISETLRPMLPVLTQNIEAAGKLDAAICKAILARRYNCVKPLIGGETLLFEETWNPEIDGALASRGRSFTPLTVELPKGVTILTGANMGGKSVAIKTIVLNMALALSGFFVFCKKAHVPAFDRVELINKDFSSAIGGLSGFGGEIVRFNEAVGRLDEGGLSLFAMDEFARGTNSEEGAAIVRSVVKYLNEKNAVTVIATHYDGAAKFASRRYQTRGLSGDSTNHMDYGLVEVGKDEDCPRDAVKICRILGMKEEILKSIEEESSW